MDITLMISVVIFFLVIGLGFIIFSVTDKMNKKIDSLSVLLNKVMIDNDEAKKHLEQVTKTQLLITKQSIIKDNQMILDYHKSFIEKESEKIRIDLDIIKERLDYLSTEVNID